MIFDIIALTIAGLVLIIGTGLMFKYVLEFNKLNKELRTQNKTKEYLGRLREAVEVLDEVMPNCDSHNRCRDINKITWEMFKKEINKPMGESFK